MFDGVILLSPGLAIDKKFNNSTVRFLGRTMAKIAPGAGLIQLKAAAITSDPEIVSISFVLFVVYDIPLRTPLHITHHDVLKKLICSPILYSNINKRFNSG